MKKIVLIALPLVALISLIVYEKRLGALHGDKRRETAPEEVQITGTHQVHQVIEESDSIDKAQEIADQKAVLKDLVLSLEEAPVLVERIERAQENIARLEKERGIETLNKKIARLRQENCRIQEKDPKIVQYRREIKDLSRQIKKTTAPEQKLVRQLISKSKGLDQTDIEAINLKKEMKKVNKTINEKTRELRKQIEALNKRIEEIMEDQLAQGAPLVKELKERYKQLRSEVKPYAKVLKREVARLKNLVEEDEQINKVRYQIKLLQSQLHKHNPCEIFTESETSWVDFLL